MAEPATMRGTNGYAIASLVLGILGLTFAPVGPIALWLGYKARNQIDRTGQDGRGLATAGIVLGWIGTILIVLGVVVVILVLAATTTLD